MTPPLSARCLHRLLGSLVAGSRGVVAGSFLAGSQGVVAGRRRPPPALAQPWPASPDPGRALPLTLPTGSGPGRALPLPLSLLLSLRLPLPRAAQRCKSLDHSLHPRDRQRSMPLGAGSCPQRKRAQGPQSLAVWGQRARQAALSGHAVAGGQPQQSVHCIQGAAPAAGGAGFNHNVEQELSGGGENCICGSKEECGLTRSSSRCSSRETGRGIGRPRRELLVRSLRQALGILHLSPTSLSHPS